MQPRALPVLVLGWGELEVDVLSESDGISSPAEAIRRAGQENHTPLNRLARSATRQSRTLD